MKVQEIEKNGKIYIQETHDDGFVCEHIKYKGTPVQEVSVTDKLVELAAEIAEIKAKVTAIDEKTVKEGV